MGDGLQSGEKQRCAQSGKAGWLRKFSGKGLLGGSWKDRYIRLQKAQILVYEHEEDKAYEEIIDLSNYEKCQDLRGFGFKKKNHLKFGLVRRSGVKVPEPKFQFVSVEEKESWFSVLNEAISQASNKAFDEVKVDESISLDHLTRNRAKINHTRRPPSRQHLKEVASSVSDGMQRLELGHQSGVPKDSTDGVQRSKENAESNTNKTRPILMPKVKNNNTQSNNDPEPSLSQSKEQISEEVKEPDPKKDKKPMSEEGKTQGSEEDKTQDPEESKTQGSEEDKAQDPEERKKQEVSCTTKTISDNPENEGQSLDLQAKAISDTNENKELSETSRPVASVNAAANGGHLSMVKCASLGDILSECKQNVKRKQFDTFYTNMKKKNVEQMEEDIALELKVTQELLHQVSETSGEKGHLQSDKEGNGTQDNQPPGNAENLLNEAVAKWKQANEVLQELKDLKELWNKSGNSPSEQVERRRKIVTKYRKSVP
ncbi:pleckstrin homology domain-containing family O member 2 isoform X1 [Callorhinchus milii]|uniref:pleckstrin homology domain-containing family O member 2 isoform X1 n=1 Tax=Callorhinchus milii TaxID=7868 RepID=UPI001C3F71C0|nr:pleckstrin homology domain-containing family O member 2 isoform X1 [Callorhinchus milii]